MSYPNSSACVPVRAKKTLRLIFHYRRACRSRKSPPIWHSDAHPAAANGWWSLQAQVGHHWRLTEASPVGPVHIVVADMKVPFLEERHGVVCPRTGFAKCRWFFRGDRCWPFRASLSRIWRRHMAEWPRYRARCRARRNRNKQRMGYQPLAEHEALAFELDGNKRSAPPLRLFPGRNRRHQTQ